MADNVDNPNPDPAAAAPAAGVEPAAGAPTEPAAAVAAEPAVAEAARPDGLPETFWDAQAKAPKFGEIAARLARADELEAAETARKEGVPEKADAYKLDPSGDPIPGPDGKPLAIDAANPLAQAVTKVAHQHGLPQAVVSDLARAFIETQVAEDRGLREAMDAEVAKLGDKAKERIGAVQGFIKQHCGDNADAAIAVLGTAGAVQAWEAVMTKISGAAMTAAPGQDVKPKGLTETWFPSMKTNKAA